MLMLGAIGFAAPWLLLALAALPILWILLRAVPPAPIQRRFPGVALLLGLTDDESQTDKTPWWLLLLRMLAVAALIVGFSGPVLNPQEKQGGDGPLLVLLDGTWADARDWDARMERVELLLGDAARTGRVVAVLTLTDLSAGDIPFQAADVWQRRLAGIAPNPWDPDAKAVARWGEGLTGEFETYWLSDGVARETREVLISALKARGPLTVYESARALYAVRPPVFEEGEVRLSVLRLQAGAAEEVAIGAYGLDPAGIERQLTTASVRFENGDTEAQVALSLPPELRNRVARFEVLNMRSAAAVALTDDTLKRREVALIAGREDREGLELLSPLHYLNQALEPTVDLIKGALADILQANPDVIVLADVAQLAPGEAEELTRWVENGGLLLRFAGPRLAASDVSRTEEDPLMPVRLRAGGRSIGGAMSWGEPKLLRPFSDDSIFRGLTIPDDVRVSAQVLAQPDPALAARVLAALADGTPLVTRKRLGAGQVVLFHVTANAEWSNLPLSGLFVQMLERLAVSSRTASPEAEELSGTIWVPDRLLDGFGQIGDARQMAGVAGELLISGETSAALPPGLYRRDDQVMAVNVISAGTRMLAVVWPPDVPVEGGAAARETNLKGPLLAGGLLLLLLDILASLWLGGRLRDLRGGIAVALVAALVLPRESGAQTAEEFALLATREVVLAHVITGDSRVDAVAAAGLRGLSQVLFNRTSIEPADPIAVNLETDELSFFPLLYWPVSTEQPIPSAEAYARLNRYLRSGGMILFDTRDGDRAAFGGESAEARKLQQLARPLDIPPLEPIPPDHVLTRTFYLLQDFPGRYTGARLWVEAAPPDAVQLEGMPFRNLNDGVTPVVIGGNDWAAAWAVDERGNLMFQVGRGYGGERQREIAYRFGVNLVMYVLTGNYKSDQVHVPALLDRLGQ